MRIEVEPQALIDAGRQVGSLGTQLGALSDALGQALSSGIASGADPAGLNFGISYGRQADQFAQYLAQAANAFKNVGLMLEATGFNYQHADQASAAGGPGPSGSVSGEPAETTAGDAPYGPNGSIVTPPTKYHLITPFIRLIPAFGMAAGVAMTWPSGNSGMMNVTAAQWRNIGQGLKVFESALSGVKAAVGAQSIPEGATITTALADLGSGTTALAGVADGLATSISDFAAGVLETQDAIRDLLDRISLDGLWDTVTGFLSGEGARVLREIADDVSTVLENFQNQVRGVLGLLEELTTLLGEAADAFQKWMRPVLVEAFGDDAGNAPADGIKLFTDIQVGGATGLIALVSGTVALADPDTWKGIADTALMVAKDPSLIDDVLKQMGSEFIALDEWQGDNPGRGFGEAAVNVASLFVPGGAFAKGGAVAKGLAATRNLLERGELGSLGRLPGLGGGRTPDAPELPNVTGMPHVPDFTPPPGIPGSVLGPGGSSSPAPTAPTSPGSGSGGGSAPTGPSPNGSGPSQSGGGAVPGSSSSNGPAPTGGSPSAGGGDGPSEPSGGAPVPPSMSSTGDSAGSGGPDPVGGGGQSPDPVPPGPVSGDSNSSASGDDGTNTIPCTRTSKVVTVGTVSKTNQITRNTVSRFKSTGNQATTRPRPN
ncbi:MAG: PE domain-containing protein [Mycobacterium sp.]|nr:PE domain-containing protein [Mycobacterium sp.]